MTFRQLRKNPGFAVTAIVTLALGIGATAAIFSLVNAVVLRPLPFPHPERLVWVQKVDHTAGLPPSTTEPLSYPDYFDWRVQSHSFQGMASYRGTVLTLTGSGPAQQLQAVIVSANFFRVLGVHPVIGRDFVDDEEKPGVHVAILSHSMWQSAFGGAHEVVGHFVVLDGVSYRVAGVMPVGFSFPLSSPAPDMWVTMARDGEEQGRTWFGQRGADTLDVVGRLKPDVTQGHAGTELDAIARRLAEQYPDTNKPYTSAFVSPMLEHLVGDYRPALRILFASVLCLLLISCANVAGLLLVHSSRRAPEIAVRAALGASRVEVIRQILVESVLLSLCGGALGITFSSWILGALVRAVPQNIPRLDQINVDSSVLAFVTAVSVLTGILFGVAPAWRASRLDPALALRDLGRGATAGTRRSRLHNGIVIAETALGMVLLAASGLLIRSFVQVLRVKPGFDPQHVLTVSLSLPDRLYSNTQKVIFYNRLMPRLAALPGVQSVAAGYPLPLAEGALSISFQVEGRPVDPGDAPSEQLAVVTPGFFQTMRIPMLAGREFSPSDDKTGQPVILINERFAGKYFGGVNPIGKHINPGISDGDGKPPMREIVGVVGNVNRKNLMADTEPIYYLPWAQVTVTSPSLCIRSAGEPMQLLAALRAEIAQLDPNVPLYRVRTFETLMSNAAAEPWFHMLLVTSFALLALGLSAVGLYAVLSYMVVQRTLEIGLRMALGARRGDVLRWVLRRGMLMAVLGVLIGLAFSAVLTRYMQGLLFGVKPLDLLTLAAVSAALLAVSALASGLPALRAARMDPRDALRDQ